MASSGLTAISTNSDTAVTAITSLQLVGAPLFNVIIVNTGANPGFYSLDNGVSWNYLTAQVSSVPGGVFLTMLQ